MKGQARRDTARIGELRDLAARRHRRQAQNAATQPIDEEQRSVADAAIASLQQDEDVEAAGINIQGSGSIGNIILNNRVGTNPDGTRALGNSLIGVFVGNGASGTTIGPANVISGNGTDGVHIAGAGTSGNVVGANRIGAPAKGTTHVGNGTDGVRVDGGSTSNAVVSSAPSVTTWTAASSR